MNYSTIKNHLRPYKIIQRRRTTINHAFASAIAPHDQYNEKENEIRLGLEILGQNPDESLICVYCYEDAQTWDHVFGTVKDSRFSGHGHRLGNLVPCCKSCNSSKGNRNWQIFLAHKSKTLAVSEEEQIKRERLIIKYLKANAYSDSEPNESTDFARYQEIQREVLALLEEADTIAERIRST